MTFIGDRMSQPDGKSMPPDMSAVMTPIIKIREDVISSEQGNFSVQDILEMSRGEGGHKVMIAALSLLVILPFGAVPGVPAIAGVILALLFLNELLWFYNIKVPKLVERFRIKRKVVLNVVCGMDKCFSKVEGHLHEDRLSFLNSVTSIRIVAILGLILSLAMVLIGFIPFVPTLLMLPVLMFSIGILAKDGLFVAIGYGLVLLIGIVTLTIVV